MVLLPQTPATQMGIPHFHSCPTTHWDGDREGPVKELEMDPTHLGTFSGKDFSTSIPTLPVDNKFPPVLLFPGVVSEEVGWKVRAFTTVW